MTKQITRFYNQGSAYELVPALVRHVNPGETHTLSNETLFKTAVFTAGLATGALASMQYYYVPYRLLWDDFREFFAMDDDFAGTFPTTTVDWDSMFDRTATLAASGKHSSMTRRAYKLIYNRYHGNEDLVTGSRNCFYSDIKDDTVVSLGAVKNTEQYLLDWRKDDHFERPTFPVSGPIDLIDFARAQKDLGRSFSANTTGDQYVDALARCGVKASWKIQNEPEYLGGSSSEVDERNLQASDGANIGDLSTRHTRMIRSGFKNKKFNEPGLVMGLFNYRPHLFNSGVGHPPHADMQTIEAFYRGRSVGFAGVERGEQAVTSGSGVDLHVPEFIESTRGFHAYGNGNSWILRDSDADVKDVVYPAPTLVVNSDLGGAHFAIASAARHTVKGGPPAGWQKPK